MVQARLVIVHEHHIGVHELAFFRELLVFLLELVTLGGQGVLLLAQGLVFLGQRLLRLLQLRDAVLKGGVFLAQALQLRLLRRHVVLRLVRGVLGVGKLRAQLLELLVLRGDLALRIGERALRLVQRLLHGGELRLPRVERLLPHAKLHALCACAERLHDHEREGGGGQNGKDDQRRQHPARLLWRGLRRARCGAAPRAKPRALRDRSSAADTFCHIALPFSAVFSFL